ncbi:restriction endonuclease [Dactylosporangium sp. NPDC000555]|uniref:restriction endonuclease n=1 Tax=Dactylosporangium sp. NPDC000555 TaxID=3154260 RepID=UPI003333D2CF
MTDPSSEQGHPSVYISYSDSDASAAALIARGLPGEFNVRLNWADPVPQPLDASLLAPLKPGDTVVVLLSADALASPWGQAETAKALALEARRRKIGIVPVLLEPCPLPEAFRDRVVVDLSRDGALGVPRLIARLRGDRAVDFKSLSHRDFERLVGEVLTLEGFSVEAVGGMGDVGYDFVVSKDDQVWLAEVRHYSQGRLSVDVVHRMAFSVLRKRAGARGLLITSTQITSLAAEQLVESAQRVGVTIRVIDGVELKQMVLGHPELIDHFFVNARIHAE